jgi:acetolactate synthase I/II/III large subunit
MKGSAADILVRYLEQEGIEYVFGVPGGHLLAFYDALERSGRLKPVLTKNEQGASYMANGYARVSGRPGLCCGTVGPGATNLVSGVAAAYMDSTPLVVLTAQVGTTAIGKGALQEAAGDGRTVDQVALFRPITKYSTMVTRSVLVPDAIRKAIRIATTGRPGPVHLDLPSDVLKGQIDDPITPPSQYRPASPGGTVDERSLRRAADLLKNARRPGMLVGGGAVTSGAFGEVLALAERLGIPVGTSLRGKGAIPEDHPLSLGCVGLYGTRAANSYLRSGLDVLLAVGVSFHEFTTHVWDPAFQPKTALIQMDIDPAEIGKNYPVDLALVGDARALLRGILSAMDGALAAPEGRRDEIVRFKKEHEYFDEPAMRSKDSPLKPQRAMVELREALPPETIVFTDIGNNLTWVERCFQAVRPGTVVSLSGLAAMGSGVAAVVGGKFAAPDRPVVCVCGDGDFQMNGMEVLTAVNYRLPVIWVILNNSRLSMIYDIQKLMFQGRYIASTFHGADFVGLARAMGADAYQVSQPGELGDVVRTALAGGNPTIIDVAIDPEELPPMKPRMMALERSIGLPEPTKTISWASVKAFFGMLKER